MNKALADVQTEPESAVKEFHIEIGMITSRLEAVRAVKGSTADLSAYLARFDAVDGSRSVSFSKTESLLCAGPCSNFRELQTTDSLTLQAPSHSLSEIIQNINRIMVINVLFYASKVLIDFCYIMKRYYVLRYMSSLVTYTLTIVTWMFDEVSIHKRLYLV